MAFPVGVTTATCTAGSDLSFFGTDVQLAADVEVIIGGNASHIVWSATGQPFDTFIEEVAADAGSALTFQLPHVDQPGFKTSAGDDITMWAYRITVRARRGNQMKERVKNFQLLTGQTVVDLDNIPDGAITIPVTAPVLAVVNIGGLEGPVITTDQLAGLLGPSMMSAGIVGALIVGD